MGGWCLCPACSGGVGRLGSESTLGGWWWVITVWCLAMGGVGGWRVPGTWLPVLRTGSHQAVHQATVGCTRATGAPALALVQSTGPGALGGV